MKALVTCLAKPGRSAAAAPPLAPSSPRAPRRRSVVRRAVAPPAPAARTAGAPPRRTPTADAEAALVADVAAGGAGGPGAAAPSFSNNVVAVDAALLPSAAHALPVHLPPAHATLPALSGQQRFRRSSFCELQLPGPCVATPHAWRPGEPCAQVAPARPPAAPLTTAMACELANAHAPYMQVRPRHGRATARALRARRRRGCRRPHGRPCAACRCMGSKCCLPACSPSARNGCACALQADACQAHGSRASSPSSAHELAHAQ